jgi:hypothetical protein
MGHPNIRAVNLKGENGGVYISGTETVNGDFDTILCLAQAVADLTASNLTGDSLAAVEIPAGLVLWGKFTAITLASGAVIAYKSS